MVVVETRVRARVFLCPKNNFCRYLADCKKCLSLLKQTTKHNAMTTHQLESRIISVHKVSYGTWWVKTLKRGKIVTHTTHDASAIDRYYDHQYNDVRPLQRSNRYTYKEALKALYTSN